MNIPRLIKSNARVVSKSTLSRLGGLGEITSPGIPEQRSMADMPNIFMSKIREVPTIKLSLTHCMLCSPTLNAAIVDPTPPLRPDLMDDPDMPVLAVISSDLLDDDDNDDNNNVFSMLYNDNHEIAADVNPIKCNLALEQECLHQAMELIRMEAEHIDMFGRGEEDEDEMVTNVEGLFQELGECLCYIVQLVLI